MLNMPYAQHDAGSMTFGVTIRVACLAIRLNSICFTTSPKAYWHIVLKFFPLQRTPHFRSVLGFAKDPTFSFCFSKIGIGKCLRVCEIVCHAEDMGPS